MDQAHCHHTAHPFDEMCPFLASTVPPAGGVVDPVLSAHGTFVGHQTAASPHTTIWALTGEQRAAHAPVRSAAVAPGVRVPGGDCVLPARTGISFPGMHLACSHADGRP